MRVVHVAQAFAPVGPDAVGGAEQVLTALDAAFAERGEPSVVVAASGSVVRGELVPFPSATGRITSCVRKAAHSAQRAALAEVLRTRAVDLVHMHGHDFADVLPADGPPVLVTLHLPRESYPPGALPPTGPDLHFNCVSWTQHRTMQGLLPLLDPVENGVPVGRLGARVSRRAFVLAVGRICPEKGFDDALDAAHRAGLPLLLAGRVFPYEAHEQHFERDIAPRLDGLRRFIGPAGFRRKRRLLGSARCLLVPSRAPETSSLVAMEALACGTPVIAYRAGALTEVVEHGRTGFIVQSVQEMAEAMHACSDIDPELCRRVAHERFDVSRMVDGYRARYHEILARGASAHAA